MKRVGLLGGSFNPAHAGHRQLSVEALRRLRLDEVWWLVSPQNPLKPAAGMAPLAVRLASARAVARHQPRIRVSAIEVELGTRFAVDTVAALRHRYRRTRFVWLVGADILPELHRWHRWRDLLRSVPVAVLARPRYEGTALRSPAMAWARRWRRRADAVADWPDWPLPAVLVLDTPANPVSATAIRAANPDWANMAGPIGND